MPHPRKGRTVLQKIHRIPKAIQAVPVKKKAVLLNRKPPPKAPVHPEARLAAAAKKAAAEKAAAAKKAAAEKAALADKQE